MPFTPVLETQSTTASWCTHATVQMEANLQVQCSVWLGKRKTCFQYDILPRDAAGYGRRRRSESTAIYDTVPHFILTRNKSLHHVGSFVMNPRAPPPGRVNNHHITQCVQVSAAGRFRNTRITSGTLTSNTPLWFHSTNRTKYDDLVCLAMISMLNDIVCRRRRLGHLLSTDIKYRSGLQQIQSQKLVGSLCF
jgi:hypothetical protein